MIKTTLIHPAAVIFDMDGLMLDTERPALAHWMQVTKAFGWDISEEVVLHTFGVNASGTRDVFMKAYGTDFPYQDIRAEVSRRNKEEAEQNGISYRPGLIVLLDHLAQLQIPCAVATSTARDAALWKLRKAGIADRFVVKVCGDEITQGKPAPDIFLRALEHLGTEPDDSIGFEDSPAGLQSLHAAGIRSVFIKDLIEPPPQVLATVWRRCTDLSEAVSLFA
ncbi:MAG: HAD family phosphatase [Treponema sp.]|jgi:HAD superfamily hydrolase (TIGR01509 family)|nr:HAD family phosphatase [Treponema sp.]